MSAPPTRCCVRTLKGDRCQNDVSPTRGWTMIGPVRLAACGLSGHQTALRNLPAFVRHDAYCGAVGCDRPSAAGICPMHRDMYRDFGITEHMLLQEPAAMTEPAPIPVPSAETPTAPQEAAGVGATSEPHPLEIRRDALVARLFAAGFVESPGPSEHLRRFDGPNGAVLIPIGHPCEVEQDFANTLDHAEKECAKVETAKEHDYCRPGCGHDGEPTAPGPTVAELETQLAAERARADAAERDAVEERERADEALTQAREANDQLKAIFLAVAGYLPESGDPLPQRVATALEREHERGDEAVQYLQELRDVRNDSRAELHAVCLLMQRLGSYGPDASAMLMRLLPVESRRALLEIEVADARAELARARANVVDPPTPERLAEVSARIAALDARIAALDSD